MVRLLKLFAKSFDLLDNFYDSYLNRKFFSVLLVLLFILSLGLIELNRSDWLYEPYTHWMGTNHFFAIDIVFSVLLGAEILSLVFVLPQSFSSSVAKQFEILSLILLRNAFKEFGNFSEPIQWNQISEPVLHMIADGFGALLIFVALNFFYNMQRHAPITQDTQDQNEFVTLKKMLSFFLLVIFVVTGISKLVMYLEGQTVVSFFDTFYKILIFSDILIVLISIKYNYQYWIIFRNSGFALSTVLIRLSLTAPPYVNVGLGIASALLAIGLSYVYNKFGNMVLTIDRHDYRQVENAET